MKKTILAALVCAGTCGAQAWEACGAIGYGWYRAARVNAPGAEAAAGIRNRFAAGASVTENLYDRFSGELRYLYQDGDAYLSLGGRSANVQAQSHAFTYEVLAHARPREQKLRPYLAAGIGAKYYRTTGPEPNPQPAPRAALLVHENQWRLLVSVGGGVKYYFDNHLVVRADFRDFITPFPKKLFVPANGATDRGLFQMFAPTVGVGYWF